MLCVLRESNRQKLCSSLQFSPSSLAITGSLSSRYLAQIANMKSLLGIFASKSTTTNKYIPVSASLGICRSKRMDDDVRVCVCDQNTQSIIQKFKSS